MFAFTAGHCSAQGFINLGFESATFVPFNSFDSAYVQFGPAFPGWTATVGGVQQTSAISNTFSLDTSGISIINRNFVNPVGRGGLIQGNYTAILQAGYSGFIGNNADTTLSQTGQIPIGTQSLQFKAFQEVGGSTAPIPFSVMLDGQNLSLVILATGANYNLYGASISSWSGKTASLAFTVFAENPHVDN